MKYLFTITVVALMLMVSCQSNNKAENKETQQKLSKTSVTAKADDNTAEITLHPENPGMNPMEVNMSEATVKTGGGQEPTPEEKEKNLQKRRAKTAFNNGMQYYQQGELDEAIKAFKNVLELDENNDKAYYNIGKIYAMQNQPDLALSYYQDAVKYNPNDSASLVGIGMIYFNKGDLQKANNYYNQAIQVAPKYALAYYNRGTVNGQMKNYQASLSDLDNAIKFEPNNDKSYMNRGLAYFYLNDRDKACIDWEKAAEMGNEEAKKAISIYCTPKKPGENK
ncbi:MAG: tetratricopeptide repeat protein [Bacteroidales bacterium]|jgi:tetratricopeptide (TPR) repeat protein